MMCLCVKYGKILVCVCEMDYGYQASSLWRERYSVEIANFYRTPARNDYLKKCLFLGNT